MAFIFYMSSNNGQISKQQSNNIVNLIKSSDTKIQNKTENKIINKNSKANKNAIKAQQAKDKKLSYIVRKNAHGFMYMILSVLVSSIFFVFNKRGMGAIIYILFICLFYAVTDEFHQSFVSGRTSLVSDVLIDFGGALIGLVFFYLVYYKIYSRWVIKKKVA